MNFGDWITFRWLRRVYLWIDKEIVENIDVPLLRGLFLLLFKTAFWAIIALFVLFLAIRFTGLLLLLIILVVILELAEAYGKRRHPSKKK